jgi:hypothetical protein
LPARLVEFPKLFFGLGSLSIHALHGSIDFRSTLCSEAFGSRAKLVGGLAPSLELGVSLVPKDRLLQLDLLAEALDIVVHICLKRSPLRLKLRLNALPSRLIGHRLLFEDILKFIARLVQIGENLVAFLRAPVFSSAALSSSDARVASISSIRAFAQFR